TTTVFPSGFCTQVESVQMEPSSGVTRRTVGLRLSNVTSCVVCCALNRPSVAVTLNAYVAPSGNWLVSTSHVYGFVAPFSATVTVHSDVGYDAPLSDESHTRYVTESWSASTPVYWTVRVPAPHAE